MHNLDEQLNKHLLKIIVNFFLILGFAAFLSMCVAFIGILYLSNVNNFIGITQRTSINSVDVFEFAGYNSWGTFTDNCCCMVNSASLSNQTSLGLVENWKCFSPTSQSKFVYKQRLRVNANGKSGLRLRPYCSKTFTTDVCRQPYLNTTLGGFQVRIINSYTFINTL